ncbi:Cof-type HAD-IIB family hydrolase [Chloroflexota bacterium]
MTNQHYKLLVIDIDGTLINKYGDISAENTEALSLVQSSGRQVALSTGRSLKSSLQIINQLSLEKYHIFFDGALVCDPGTGEEIYAQPIDKPVVKQMIEFAHRHDIDLELFSTTHYFAERETWSTETHRHFFGIEPNIGDFTGIWEQEIIIKGELVVNTPLENDKSKSFGSHFADIVNFSRVKVPTYPDVIFVNILAPDTSKGKALEVLSAHLGISLAKVVAIGDGRNDISLLSAAGLGIAMGNAHDEVKKVADHITLHVDEHGLAAAIKQFFL